MSRAALAALSALATAGAVAGVFGAVLPARAATIGTLTNVSLSASSTVAGAASSYTYTFTTVTAASLTSIQLSVPSGTSGTPALGSASQYWAQGTNLTSLGSPTPTLSGTTVTVPLNLGWINAGSIFSLQITGLTNTTTAGSSSATIGTYARNSEKDDGTTNPVPITSAALTNPGVQPTSTLTGATGTTYTYRFTTATTASLSTITMTLPPDVGGTAGGSPSVSPAALAGGSLSQSGSLLTYTFTATSVPAGTPVSIAVTGLTNTTDAVLSYPTEIATLTGSTGVDSATTDAISFTPTALTGPTLSASALSTGAAGTSYTYGFTTATDVALVGFQMSVPPGTAGTPALGAVSIVSSSGNPITLATPTTVALSGTTLSVGFGSTQVGAGSVASIQITGLTNTTTAGSYRATILTLGDFTYRSQLVDSAVTAAVTLTSTSLSAVSWQVSTTKTGATGVSYSLSFQLPVTSTLTAFSMSVPPNSGTTATLTSVTPSAIAGGTLSVSDSTVTYTLPTATSVSSANTITLVYTITNTNTASVYASTVTAMNGATVLATGTTGQVTFTSGNLTGLGWSSTSSTAGASGVTYTFQFTTSTGANVTAATMSVPPGTAGTPQLGTVTIYSQANGAQTPTAQSISLAQNTLTYSVSGLGFLNAPATFTIQISGLTNTGSVGTYASAVATKAGSTAVDSGTTPTLSFSAGALSSTTWSTDQNKTGATNATYTYSFVPSTTITLDTLTMTVPAGTTGSSLTIGTVTPTSLDPSGTQASLNTTSNVLTYTLPAAITISGGTTVGVAVSGFTNTTTAGSYPSTITASYQGTAEAAGTAATVSFASSVLSNVSWSVSATHTAATNVTYTYQFTTGTGAGTNIGAVTMTIPPGTGPQGAVGVGTVTGIGTGTASLDQTSGTITYTLSATKFVAAGTQITITLTGLTNGTSLRPFYATVTTRTGSSGGSNLQSGTATSAVTLVGGPLVNPTWAASSLFTTAPATYSYKFETASTSTLDAITMTVPSGTTGTPAVDTASVVGLPSGGTISLSGTTLTYTFTATMVNANTAVTLPITGLSNPLAEGTYTSYLTTCSGTPCTGTAAIDTGTTSPAVTLLQDRALTFTNSCPVDPGGCSIDLSGATEVTLIAIPGASVASTASVVLGVQTNAVAGYLISALLPVLTDAHGDVLAQAATTGTDTPSADQFYASASLAGSSTSNAALCSPYGSVTPFVGYSSIGQSVWHAAGPTDNETDVVTIVNGVRVSATQPAGTYTGTISYQVTPAYSGTAPSCTN